MRLSQPGWISYPAGATVTRPSRFQTSDGPASSTLARRWSGPGAGVNGWNLQAAHGVFDIAEINGTRVYIGLSGPGIQQKYPRGCLRTNLTFTTDRVFTQQRKLSLVAILRSEWPRKVKKYQFHGLPMNLVSLKHTYTLGQQ